MIAYLTLMIFSVFAHMSQTFAAEPPQQQSVESTLPVLPILSRAKGFNDLYAEQAGLTKAETVALYLQLRSGWFYGQNWESYAGLRFGADTRTVLGNTDAVYNDNYVFVGVGTDYLGLLPGVRATLQLGVSKDLNSNIHLGGLDGRFGFISYHEWKIKNSNWYGEFYSEDLYIQRYKNMLGNFQSRLLYDWVKFSVGRQNAEFGPMMNLVLNWDSSGLDYNRFAEARFGFRLKVPGSVSFIINPYYSFGTRWERPTQYPTYQDLRLLVAASAAL